MHPVVTTLQAQVSRFDFFNILTGLAIILSIIWHRVYRIVVSINKKLIIGEMSLVLCQTGNPVCDLDLTRRPPFIRFNTKSKSLYTCRERTWWNLDVSKFTFLSKSTNRKSLVGHILEFP